MNSGSESYDWDDPSNSSESGLPGASSKPLKEERI
jgi:hypothetical protein